ncbi:MAG: DUF1587 domain-containing protein, partial [Verrucomicrobiae bacterium]|nr:DUF1587 domain-containing protein [Verrucomicrobiae bacterium]
MNHLSENLIQAFEVEKGTVFRRLNRREYENTLNDLFGTRLDLVRQLPVDGLADGFDNVGEALNISMVQMERYLDAMSKVLDAAISKGTRPPESRVISASYVDSPGEQRHFENTWLKRDDGAAVFFKSTGYPDGSLREASPKISGRYKIRITGYAYQSEKPLTFSLEAKTYQRGADQPLLGYFSLPP